MSVGGLKKLVGRYYFITIVVAVIIAAFLLRCFQASSGLPYLYFWDEPNTASTALRIMKTGDYNPHYFNYGSLTIYLNVFVDKIHYWYLVTHTSEIASLSDIKINADTGWYWTISHPSFYYWNRILTVVLGTGTVIVTFFIGRVIFNKWIGLIAAIFLATLPIHINHSALITTDAPVAFFVLSVVLFTIYFIKTEKLIYFILSLVFVGLAIATKYNAGISYLLPLTSLLWMGYKYKKFCSRAYWILLFTLPAAIFITAMPYAILDFPAFIQDVLTEMRHYKILGHKGAESIPGWDHFLFQMNNFYNNIGLLPSVLALIGFVGLLFRPLLAITLLLPMVYIMYMSSMKVNFHRNFIQVYPFISILIGSSFFHLNEAYNSISIKLNLNNRWLPIALMTIGVAYISCGQVCVTYSASFRYYKENDTRANAIDLLNNIKSVENVYIAKELRIHSNDLRRLRHKHSIIPLELMVGSEKKDSAVFLIPLKVKSQFGTHSLEVKSKQNIIDKVNEEDIIKIIGNDGYLFLDKLSINPAIAVVREVPDIKLAPSVIPLDNMILSSEKIKLTRNNELILSGGGLTTPAYILESGQYNINLKARKKKSISKRVKEIVLGKYKVKVALETDNKVGTDAMLRVSARSDDKVISEEYFTLQDEYMSYSIPLNINSNEKIHVKIDYISNMQDSSSVPILYAKDINISSVSNDTKY